MVYPTIEKQLPGTPYTVTTYESQHQPQSHLPGFLQAPSAAALPRASNLQPPQQPQARASNHTPAQAHFFKQLQAAAVALGLPTNPRPVPVQNRRPTLTPTAQSSANVSQFERQRLQQIRHHQQILAYLAAMSSMNNVNALESSVGSLPPFAGAQLAGDDKTDGGFNASFGLNPMSADDPSWIGHGFQAQAAEDFLSSPDWTDPSPALTDSMSFDLDSCDTSPLLGFDDSSVPGIAGAPLFSPMDGYASSNVSPLEASQNDFGSAPAGDFGAPEMGSDFTLFPDVSAERQRPAEMAFSQTKANREDLAVTLLRALSSAALQGANVVAPATSTSKTPTEAPALDASAALTTSPLFVSGDVAAANTSTLEPTPEPTVVPAAPAPSPAPATAETAPRSKSPEIVRRSSSSSTSSKTESRGTKRRFEPSDLLPLDAPIQPRKYHTVSATSRRDTPATSNDSEDPFADDEAAIRKEKDPRVAKRLSNTLAARRSRHRKAEELRNLHETIDSLRNEVEMWKKRCERAEKERDEVCN